MKEKVMKPERKLDYDDIELKYNKENKKEEQLFFFCQKIKNISKKRLQINKSAVIINDV